MVSISLKFLWTFLLRTPPLEIRGELLESFPNESVKGTLISSGGVPGTSVRNSTHYKVMRHSSDGKANETSGFPPGIS